MAGTKRFAAKLLIWSSVLAAGATGAYYATSSRAWHDWLHRHRAPAAQLIADISPPIQTDLDAVASSWASGRNADDNHLKSDESISPAARSADATLATVGPADATPASLVGSRYAATPPADDDPEADREPTIARAENLGPPTANEPATPSGTTNDSPLARGQDPNDADESIDDLEPASDASRSLQPLTEPRGAEPRGLQLPATSKQPAATSGRADAATSRAREAFGQSPAAADQSAGRTPDAAAANTLGGTNTTIGSRYATLPANSPRSAPGDGAGPAQHGGLANPFASPPTIPPENTAEATTGVPRALAGAPTEPREFGDSLAADGDPAMAPSPIIQQAPRTAEPAPSSASPFSAANNGRYRGADQSPLQPAPSTPLTTPLGSSAFSGPSAAAIDGTGKPGERALEGLQKPALTIQKFAPPEIQVGKPAQFTVQVRNVGSQAAEDVVIRDEVPQGTRLISTSPAAENDGTHLVWQLGKLSIGEERTVEIQLMPLSEGQIGSVAAVSHTTQASAKSRCTMPQLAIRMTAPSKVMIGAEQRVKIELRNPGTGDATGVMLFENVPSNVRHAAGPALEFEVGTLRAGETRELELVLLAEKAGKVVNVLTARADGNLQVQQQVEFEVIAPALSVEVNGPERRYLERPATYEVTVQNPGTATARDVQLITKLPKGMRFVRANNMGEYDAASHAVYWSLAELPEGERGTVELVAMPIETGPQTLEVEGRAQQGLSDQTRQQIVVEGLAAIMFEVRDLEDPIEVGGQTGYEIRVVNQGTKAATNVRVAINLPPGLQLLAAEGESRHSLEGTRVLFEPLATLAPKADTLYRVKLQGVQAGDQRVTVEVNTDDLGQPIRREESTRVFGDE